MPTARAWREYPRRYRYQAGVCKKCGKWHFPPRRICDACRGRDFETRLLKRTGTILTHTVIHMPPAQFADQVPLVVAIVKMDEGPQITMQVVDWKPEELRRGQKVKLEFRKIQADGEAGAIHYGYKAVPISGE